MVVDTSALLAIFFHEGEEQIFRAKLSSSSENLISAASLLEAYAKVLSLRGERAAEALQIFVDSMALKTVAFDASQLAFAQDAYARYGKGRNRARLKFGDCISYGLAKAMKEPLLFKGNDFSQTDVQQA